MNLNQVTVPSRDVAAAVAFYERLGLRLIVRALPHYARFECPDGDATFSVHLVDEPPGGAATVVYFECEHLDVTVERLVAAGVVFDEPPADRDWRWREARLRDPDGNPIILFHAGRERKNPPWRIGLAGEP